VTREQTPGVGGSACLVSSDGAEGLPADRQARATAGDQRVFEAACSATMLSLYGYLTRQRLL
jgi:hypothetical protein